MEYILYYKNREGKYRYFKGFYLGTPTFVYSKSKARRYCNLKKLLDDCNCLQQITGEAIVFRAV